jgi:hypothetical protein
MEASTTLNPSTPLGAGGGAWADGVSVAAPRAAASA